MGEVTDVSYFDNADTCGMEEDECDEPIDTSGDSVDDDCCDVVHNFVPGTPVVQEAVTTFEMPSLEFIAAFTYTFLLPVAEIEPATSFTSYTPPLEQPDLQVLYQHFLI